jgi:hypothetical protein
MEQERLVAGRDGLKMRRWWWWSRRSCGEDKVFGCWSKPSGQALGVGCLGKVESNN